MDEADFVVVVGEGAPQVLCDYAGLSQEDVMCCTDEAEASSAALALHMAMPTYLVVVGDIHAQYLTDIVAYASRLGIQVRYLSRTLH
jgi:hypothetical protein